MFEDNHSLIIRKNSKLCVFWSHEHVDYHMQIENAFTNNFILHPITNNNHYPKAILDGKLNCSIHEYYNKDYFKALHNIH